MKKCFLLLLVPGLWAAADVSLPNVFSDHMVLQRGLEVPVWGWADPGEAVTVRFAGQVKETAAAEDGSWMVRLDAMEASTDAQVLDVAGKNTRSFQDVLVGDVWICSGQSNMEWGLSRSKQGEKEVAASDHPAIRLFNVPGHVTSNIPQKQVAGSWSVCSPETSKGFSGVGYFFGRSLNQESGVPIGLIGSNWGGTRIEPWVAPVGFDAVPEMQSISEKLAKVNPTTDVGAETWARYLDQVEAWMEDSRRKVADREMVDNIPTSPGLTRHSDPSAIYHAMIAPLVPYGVRGAIWYQGESNGGEKESYFHKLQALIGGWRSMWNQGDDFPFYFYIVQLANFQEDTGLPAGGEDWIGVRDSQTRAMKEIPDTGMAVIIDIGEARNIHPSNKQDVGARLALWAKRDVLGSDVVVSGPLFKELAKEDGTLRISYDHVGGGLVIGKKSGLDPVEVTPDAPLKRFAIAGEDKVWVWADARIDGDTVVVSSPEVPEPVAVRYAWSRNPEGANLYNAEGLPAVPFRTDDW